MRIDPLRRSIPTAVTRVQRSRSYAGYKLQEEHDALLHTGADKLDDRNAAQEASQAITALVAQLSVLQGTIAQGKASLQQHLATSLHIRKALAASFHREFDATLRLFNEHPALRRSWKQLLSDSLTSASSSSDLFANEGPAGAVQHVIEQIESTSASLLIEPKLLVRMTGRTGYSYSPHTRLQPYSTTIHSLSLIIQRQG
jgi:predicted exporter